MKTEKLSIFISIVLISLLALGAVSAADDTAATDDAPEASIEEVQTIDNTITNDDMSYESSDIIVNTTGDSGDLDKDSKANLASTKLSEGETSSFTNLANNINDAPSYLSLSGNYAYDSTIDGDYVTGIYINKDITINGGGTTTIDGRNVARIFNISNGHNVVLHNITFTNGNIEQGGAIYNDGNLVLKDCKFANNAAQYGGAIYNTENGVITGDSDFTSNVAVYRGGAIYSEGSVALSDSVIDGNDITYRAKNDDNGGAAIYNNGGTLTLDKVQVTNNLLDIVIRDGNDGHLINAAIFTSGDATITDSVISNNSGSWGGGIYVTNGATLDVSGTTFEKNMATFGAAIYDEGAKVIVNNCDFNENHCEGIGSAGTSSTQAAAILVMSEGASATITNSRFNKNSAKTGGAVSISQASGDVLIEGCTFTENTASYEGGAIYNYAADGAELTVKGSTFTNNTAANWGDAISNDAGLKLEGNTITGDVNTAIGNWFGTIDTQVKVKILDGQEHTVTNPTIDLTATVTDDNGNKINDHAFTFTVGAEEVPATYDATEGIYKATYTFKNPGTYTVSTDSYTLEDVTDSVITFKSSLSSLKALIDENTNGTLDLTYGFSYDDELDSAIKTVGIAINKNIIINGNGVTLSGADLARLFEINSGFTLTLNNLIISNFVGNYGPAVFVHNGATLYSNNVNYNNNIANANGGAIYSDYGNLIITGSTFTNNEAKGTYGTGTGVGSAIFDFAGINPGTTAYITDSTFTNNAGTGAKAGVYVDNAVITGSTFTNTAIHATRIASISNDVFDNEGVDINLANTGFVFYDGTGDLPVNSKATINFTGTSFQGLQDIITNSDYGTKTLSIGLHNDITRLADEEFANGIVIDKKVLINGLGNTVDVNGQGKAFYISEGADVSLRNMEIVGDGTSPIVNDGLIKDYNPNMPITFINAGEYPIDNDEGIISINYNTKTFTQLNSVISMISGGTISSAANIVTKGDDEKETFADGITITQKDLSIISSLETYQRTIDADNFGRIFNVADGASLTLKNITLQNGNAADGGAVYVNDGGKLVADSTKFLNNKATYSGGAIYATGATVSLDNCILDNNDATDHSKNNDTGGAAIYAEDSTVTISKTKVTNNGDKTLNRSNGDLINGVLNLHDSTTTITDSVFENNTGIYGGAITAETTKDEGVSKLTISGTNFTSNAAYTGGAVYVADTEFDISDSIFDANNKASGEGSTGYTAGGGALVIMSGSEGSLDNVTVKNSHASQGGAIDLENSQVTITGSKFESNSADGWAGAIYATGNSALTVEDSSFKENTAAAATIVTFGTSTATIKDSNFTDNYDTYSWGVVTVYGTGDVNIEGSKFTKDVDGTYTVDVYVVDDAKVSVKDSTFDTNSYYSIVAEDGKLTLEGNDIKSDYVPIYTVADAEIVSKVKAVISENETYYIESGEIAINATLTDDMGNMIRDANFNFVVYKGDEIAFELPATFDGQKYTATFAPTVADVYLVTLDYPVEEVQTATYYFGSVVVIDFPIPDIELGNEGFGWLNVFVYDPEAEDQYDGEQVETTANLIFKDAEGNVVLTMEGVETSTSRDTAVEFNSSKFAIGKYTVTVVLGDNFVLADDKDTFEFEVTPIFLDAKVEGSEDISYGDKDTHTITLGKYDYELEEPEFIQYDYTGTAIVKVYDYDDLVKEIEVAIVDGEGTISFENIPAGLYFYEITLDDETYAISRDEDGDSYLYELAIAHKKGTYTDLKVQIEDAIAQAELDGEEIVYIELPYNFAYDAEYDGEAFLDGIEISDSIVIDGNNMIISGEEQASIFTVAEGAVLTISDAFLAEGNGINGGAVYVSEGSIFNANNVNFVGNKASNGGAIYSEGTTTIVNSFFNKNDPEYGGAIYVAAGETLVKDNTAFIENNADFGGAIYVDSGASLTVEDSTFSKNTASSGSAIYADYGSELTISGSEFTENIASGNYGAVYIAADEATVSDSTFTKNTGGNGGAIFWTGDDGELTDSEFTENTATGSYSGGAVFVFGDGVEINGCAFEENTAANAGGAVIVFNQGNIGGHEVTINDCDFISNNAASGGAVYWTGESGTLSDSLFKENEATANGAAILATGTGFSVINSVFIENSAATDGAIYLAGNDATIKEDKFIRSAATMGAIVLDGATITVSDSLFSTNAGMPVHYNILNSGTITSIKDTTFETIVPTIEAEDSYVYGETITITGNFDWGVQQPAITMKYTINGVEGTTTVLNGEYNILIDTQPDVGDYTMVISSFTDDKGNFYEVNTAQATFSVVKASPSLEVTGDTVSWGETSTVTVKVADGETPLAGKVIVTVVWDVDSATEVVTLNETGEGEASFKLTDVAPGSYDIIATFIPDEDNYKSVVNNTEKLTITDSIESNLEVVAPSEIEDGTTLDMTATLTDGMEAAIEGKTLTYTVDGGEPVTTAATGEDGSVVISIEDLAFGEHTIVVKFDDGVHAVATQTVTVNVLPKKGTYTDLQYIIDNDEDGIIELPYNFAFDEEYDLANFEGFIDGVKIDKQIAINGNGHVISGKDSAAILYLTKDADLTLSDVYLLDGFSSVGSAIYAPYGSKLYINKVTVMDNENKGPYGAVYIGADNAIVVDSKFINNKGGNGAAIFWTGDNGQLADSTFTGNNATDAYSGGAVFAFGDTITIEGCTFEENTAAVNGGAVIVYNQGNIGGHNTIVRDSVFTDNAAQSGAGIYWTGETGTIDNCTFEGNDATVNGAAILSTGNGMTIKNSEFTGNTAERDGAIYLAGNTVTLSGDKFINCQATQSAVISDSATLTVEDSVFEYNTGAPVHYNILNAGTITSIEGSTFGYIEPTIVAEDAYEYGAPVVISGKFDWGVQQPAITMKYTVNGFEGTTTVINGEYNILIDTQPDVGDYTMVISSFSDDNGNFYEVNTAQATFSVVKASPVVEVTGTTVEYGDPATVKVKVTDANGVAVDGKVILTVDWVVDGITKVVDLEEGAGEATFTLDAMQFGEYSITATYIASDNYKEAVNNTEKVIVTPSTEMKLEVTANNPEYGEDAILTVTATDASGAPIAVEKVNVTIGDETKEYDVAEDGTVNIGKLDAGDTEVTVSVDDGVHDAVSEDVTVTVDPASGVDIQFTAVDVEYGNDYPIKITAVDANDNPVNGTAFLVLDGNQLIQVEIVDGEAQYNIPGLDVGSYYLEVIFNNGNYLPTTWGNKINVTKATPTVKVEDAEADWAEPANIDVTVTDSEGMPINGTAVVRVSWNVDGVDQYIDIEDGTGKATFALKDLVAPGVYDVTVFFEGGRNYNDVTATAKLTITSPKEVTLDVEVEDCLYGETTSATITVTDVGGAPVANAKVNVSIDDGEFAEYTLNENGTVTVPVEVTKVGEHNVTVKFDDGVHNPAQGTADFVVYKDIGDFDYAVAAVDYRDKLVVVITDVVDAEGNPLSGIATVYYNDGEERSATGEIVNGAGEVELTELDAGSYELLITIENENYDFETAFAVGVVNKALPEITVNVGTVEYGSIANVEIEIRGYHEETIDTTLTVLIDDVEIGEYTTVDGKVTLPVDTQPDVGTYIIDVDFAGDDNYYPATNSAKLVVTKATPVVTVEGAEVEWGSPATIKVTVSDSEGMPVEGTAVVRVSWIVDGVDQYIDITEGSGEATFEISGLVAPGEYDVKVMFLGGRNYNDVNNTDAKLVLTTPAAVNLNVNADAGEFGEDTNITVTLTDTAYNPMEGSVVTVYVDDKELTNATIGEDGTVTVPVSDLTAGDHTVKVVLDDGVHDLAEKEISFTVDPTSGANIKFTGEDVEFGNDYPIKITVVDPEDNPLDGKAIVVLDGNAIAEVDIVAGAGEYNITGLDVGSYYLEVIFNNDNYLPTNYGDKINVTRATPTVKVEDAEVEWGTPATIKVTVYDSEGMPIEGNAVVSVSWIVDGVDQYIDITEGSGEANFEISGFVAPGEYDVTVFYLAGRNYNNASATAKLTLTAPKDINVDVDVDSGDYGEDTNVTVTVTDKANAPVANAPVTVVVDGKEYNAITDENGTVTVPVSGLEAGDHNITVKVDDGVHTPAEETATATVDPASGADIQATVEPGHAGQDSIVNVSAKDPEDNPVKGNAIVIVDGEPYTEVPLDENGTASVPIKDLPTGEHTVEVVFDNPNYLPSSYTTHFDVKAQDTKLVVAVDKESIVYGDGAVTATIGLSADGKPISGVVEVILNGDPQNVTVTNGLATVKFNNLAAANYTVIGNFAGTSVYTGATDSANFNVERKATKFNYENMKTTAVNPNIDGRIGEYFYFQLLDEDGKALANKPVVIGFNGKTYNKTTNETGWARLQINLARAFRYTFAINFAGDENYTSAFNVALINVTTQAPKLTTSSKSYAASAKTKTLTATFKTKSGNAVSGRQITFTVNGKSYSAKTNAKGVATVKVSLSKKGTYSFTAKFAGDDTYSAVSKSAKLTIK